MSLCFNEDMPLTTDEFTKLMDAMQKMLDSAVAELRADFSHLPTKDEFYTKMDEVMGELQGIRLDNEAMGFRVSEHSNQIDNLEKIHPVGKHI